MNAPHQVGVGLAGERGGVGEGGDGLADLFRACVVLLELDPLGLVRELAELTDQVR
jgi:hypothetical protein